MSQLGIPSAPPSSWPADTPRELCVHSRPGPPSDDPAAIPNKSTVITPPNPVKTIAIGATVGVLLPFLLLSIQQNFSAWQSGLNPWKHNQVQTAAALKGNITHATNNIDLSLAALTTTTLAYYQYTVQVASVNYNTLVSYLAAFASYLPLSVRPYYTLYHCVILSILLGMIVLYYRLFWRPFEYIRSLARKERVNALLIRDAGDIPPACPNSWFKLCDSFQVLPGHVYKMDSLQNDFLVFRASSDDNPWDAKQGEVVILEADTCQGLDPLTQANQLKEATKWYSHELNQMIFIWHHEDNIGQKFHAHAPDWFVPIIEGMERMRYHGKVQHEIVCHIQEIPENGADTAHLNFIHGDFVFPQFKLAKHSWTATWDPLEPPNFHVAYIKITQRLKWNGWNVPFTGLDSNIYQVGPGLVQLIFPTIFGRVVVIETITPLAPSLQRANNVVWADSTVPRFFAKFFLFGLAVQFERDHLIWNHKKFIRRPLAVKEDGPILKYRRWMKQFYREKRKEDEIEQQPL